MSKVESEKVGTNAGVRPESQVVYPWEYVNYNSGGTLPPVTETRLGSDGKKICGLQGAQ
jgi:hypothetical protein